MSNTTEPQTPTTPAQNPRLDTKLAEEIAGASARLNEIRNLSPISRTRELDAEASALVEYLAGRLLEHAPELLGAWFACTHEYAPLVQALRPVVFRLLPQQPQAPAVLNRDNVVVLDGGAQ